MRVGIHIKQTKGFAETNEANNVQSQKLELVGEVKGTISAVVGVRANEMHEFGEANIDISFELEVFSPRVLEERGLADAWRGA